MSSPQERISPITFLVGAHNHLTNPVAGSPESGERESPLLGEKVWVREDVKLLQYKGHGETQSCFKRNYIVAWRQERGIYAASTSKSIGAPNFHPTTSFVREVKRHKC